MTLDFGKLNGLIPAVVQDEENGDVLMVGFMNQEALDRTVSERKVTFWSRSRERLWRKGETSGNELRVVSVTPDCDNDAVLVRVHPVGPVCHTGNRSCFGDERAPAGTINRLEKIVLDRKEHPRENSYTTTMFEKGLSRIAQKVGEEAVETILAATGDGKERTVSEAADLMYHLTVLFAAKEMSWRDVEDELRKRMG